MTKTGAITFGTLRRRLEKLGYRHEHVPRGEIFHLSKDRELYFRRYGENELVLACDLVSVRNFLDAWGQLDAADFDAFLDAAPKPA